MFIPQLFQVDIDHLPVAIVPLAPLAPTPVGKAKPDLRSDLTRSNSISTNSLNRTYSATNLLRKTFSCSEFFRNSKDTRISHSLRSSIDDDQDCSPVCLRRKD